MSDLDWLNSRLTQLTREDLATMTPSQIAEAHHRGHLQDLLTPKPSVFAGEEEQLLQAQKDGNLSTVIAMIRAQAASDSTKEEN